MACSMTRSPWSICRRISISSGLSAVDSTLSKKSAIWSGRLLLSCMETNGMATDPLNIIHHVTLELLMHKPCTYRDRKRNPKRLPYLLQRRQRAVYHQILDRPDKQIERIPCEIMAAFLRDEREGIGN